MKGEIRVVTRYTTGTGCNKVISRCQQNSNILKDTLQAVLCSN